MNIIVGCIGAIGLYACKKTYNTIEYNKSRHEIVKIDSNDLDKLDYHDGKLVEYNIKEGNIHIAKIMLRQRILREKMNKPYLCVKKIFKSDVLNKSINKNTTIDMELYKNDNVIDDDMIYIYRQFIKNDKLYMIYNGDTIDYVSDNLDNALNNIYDITPVIYGGIISIGCILYAFLK